MIKKRGISVLLLICAVLICVFYNFDGNVYATNNSKDEKTILVDEMTLQPGEYKQYDKVHLNKGDSVVANLQWDNEDGNLYIAIGTSFGQFRGLQSSGNGYMQAELTVNSENDYFIFVGVQQTHTTEAKNIHGDITINAAKARSQENSAKQSTLQSERINIDSISLTPGSHEQYGPYLFKKGEIVSIDIEWNESGNLYFAIGEEFGKFRGLKSCGRDKTSFVENLEVKEDGEYYIFVGIQGTESKNIDGITGEILYPIN